MLCPIAAKRGHNAVCRALLAAGGPVDGAGPIGRRPIEIACQNGHLETAKLLGEHGAEVAPGLLVQGVPLTAAAIGGHVALCEYLLTLGVHPDRYKTTSMDRPVAPLQVAAYGIFPAVVELLLRHGARPDLVPPGSTQPSPLIAEISSLGAGGVVMVVVELGVGSTYVFESTTDDADARERCMTLLLDGGADPNLEVARFSTPLTLAAELGEERLVRLLLLKGATPSQRTRDGRTAAMAAASFDRFHLVRLLDSAASAEHRQRGSEIAAVAPTATPPLIPTAVTPSVMTASPAELQLQLHSLRRLVDAGAVQVEE